MHPLQKSFMCIKAPTWYGHAIVSVKRNNVDTLLAFRSKQDALLAREIMSAGVWVYKHRWNCLFLAPIPAMVSVEDNTWTLTGQDLVNYGIGMFGVDECKIDKDRCIVMQDAFFLNREVSCDDARARLVHMESGW